MHVLIKITAYMHFQIRPSMKGCLLPAGSEEKEVLGVGSIPVAILPSCQYHNIASYFHRHEYSLGSENKKHLRGSTQGTILPLAIILTMALWALVSITA